MQNPTYGCTEVPEVITVITFKVQVKSALMWHPKIFTFVQGMLYE